MKGLSVSYGLSKLIIRDKISNITELFSNFVYWEYCLLLLLLCLYNNMIKCHITPELDSVGRRVSFKQKKENSFEPWLSPARAHDGMVIDNFTQVKNFLNATRTRVWRPGNRAIVVLLSHGAGPKSLVGHY